MQEEMTALSLAGDLEKIYSDFTDAIRSMGSKNGRKGKSKLALSAMNWLTGGHIRTERDVLCEKFVQDVQKHLEIFDYALEDADETTAQEACAVLADTITTPIDPRSNSTTDLMKRAMIGRLIPYLPRLSREKLTELKEKLETAYPRNQRLPVERDVLKEIGKLL
ncbi:MAG: hypothetical protein IJ106_01160 [Parasporobacterium sp.]|nr:hypothetical protein [Parasporobacterium sp.]